MEDVGGGALPGPESVSRSPSGFLAVCGWDGITERSGSGACAGGSGVFRRQGRPQGSAASFQADVQVFPPQGQALGGVGAAPVLWEVFWDDDRSDAQLLRELLDSQGWAERQENVLRVCSGPSGPC